MLDYLEDGGPYKMVDHFAALFVRETRLVVSGHDSLPCPLPDPATEVGFPTLAHLAFSTEGLQHIDI